MWLGNNSKCSISRKRENNVGWICIYLYECSYQNRFMDHSLVTAKGLALTQWSYEPGRAGLLKTDRSQWCVLTRRGPLEKEMATWCFWTVVLKKTLESPLDCKEFQPVFPKGDQSWVFIGRTGVEAETPILWPPDAESWLIWKDPDAGKDWEQREKGKTEDEMVGWHHWVTGHEFG